MLWVSIFRVMLLWIIGLGLFAALAAVGYFQGAIRVAFSLLGLLLAAVLSLPLAFAVAPLLKVLGMQHPVLLAFLAPVAVWLLFQIIFKSVGLAVHRKVDHWYKYKAIELHRRQWERLNRGLGLALGPANAIVYLFFLTTAADVLGYFTVQIGTSEQDPMAIRLVNQLNVAMQQTRMDKAVAAFHPAPEEYFDACDIIGDVYRTPLLQSRLATYPVFLPLIDQPELVAVGNDVLFQEYWQKGPAFAELINHDRLKPLVQSVELYTNVMSLAGAELKDLKEYLATGKSPKYEDEKILGRWSFDQKKSLLLTKRNKPAMSPAELLALRTYIVKVVGNAELTAFVENKATLKITDAKKASKVFQGAWKRGDTGKYSLSLPDGAKKLEAPVVVEARRLSFVKDGFSLVFEN